MTFSSTVFEPLIRSRTLITSSVERPLDLLRRLTGSCSFIVVALSSVAKTLGQHPMPETAIADRDTRLVQLLQYGPHDAGTGENDLRPFWLKANDGPACICVLRSVQFNLPIYLVDRDDCALDPRRIVCGEGKSHRSDVGHGATHADKQIW